MASWHELPPMAGAIYSDRPPAVVPSDRTLFYVVNDAQLLSLFWSHASTVTHQFENSVLVHAGGGGNGGGHHAFIGPKPTSGSP